VSLVQRVLLSILAIGETSKMADEDLTNKPVSTSGTLAKLSQLKQDQSDLAKLLQEIRVSGRSRNGRVVAVFTGEQKIVDLVIDSALIAAASNRIVNAKDDEARKEIIKKAISQHVIEAIEDAVSLVQTEVVQQIQETGSMGKLVTMLQTATDTASISQSELLS